MGICIYGVLKIDEVWKTCCSLHNWLLDIDGLNTEWVDGVCVIASDWEGPMGESDFNGLHEEIPYSIARLSTNLDPRNYDLSGMGPREDVVGNAGIDDEREVGLQHRLHGNISDMMLEEFLQRLVSHFADQIVLCGIFLLISD